MKASVVITADQIGSRHGAAPVADTLAALRPLVSGNGSRAFAQQAGDEIQGLLTDSSAVVGSLRTLTREGSWRVGVGIGEVDSPTPRDVRAANGPAFVAARHALTAARNAPQDLRVSADVADGRAVDDLQSALWLLLSLWRRRTPTGWAAVAEAGRAARQQDAAALLGITPSALSQRLRAAGRDEGEAGAALATRLLDVAREEASRTVGTRD